VSGDRGKALLALGVLVLAVLGAAAAARIDDRPEPVQFVRVAIGSEAVPSANARRYGYVIAHAWHLDARRLIDSAGATTLLYKNLSFVDCGDHRDGERIAAGVRCSEARDRGWIVEDASGAEVRSESYPWLYLARVGHLEYQQRWAENVVAEARKNSWDGVMIDDANSTLRYHLPPERLTGAVDDAQWREATGRAIETVGGRLRDAGITVVANICCEQHDRAVWREWVRHLSGWSLEHFVERETEPKARAAAAQRWARHLEAARETQSLGKIFLALSTSSADDEAAATYGLSTMLLATNGRAAFGLQDGSNSGEIWFAAYDRARRLGDPRGDYDRVRGVYRRAFARGVVYVNPTEKSVTVDGIRLLPSSGRIQLGE
jgi:Hypothetical glycosyl hydrolase family 15